MKGTTAEQYLKQELGTAKVKHEEQVKVVKQLRDRIDKFLEDAEIAKRESEQEEESQRAEHEKQRAEQREIKNEITTIRL